jgi:hypothetical protein
MEAADCWRGWYEPIARRLLHGAAQWTPHGVEKQSQAGWAGSYGPTP